MTLDPESDVSDVSDVKTTARRGCRLGLVLALVAAATPAAPALALADDAAPYVAPAFMAIPPSLPGGASRDTAWRLELAEALQLAVRHNLGISLEREAVQVARLGVEVARGAREPTVGISYRHGDNRRPPVTTEEGDAVVSAVDDVVALSYRQRFATGLVVGVGADAGRVRSSQQNAVDPVEVRSTLGVNLTQPLLRGFSLDLDIPQADILRARIGSERERRQLEVVVADVVERTERAYWDVVQALYRHDLEVSSTQRARDQLALTRRQIDAGMLPPSDVIGAESTLAQRELQQVQAELAVEQTWDRLRQVVNLPRDQWTRPILPVELPRFAPGQLTADQAMATALANRPERDQLDLDLAESTLALRKADNDRLPQLDLGLTGAIIGRDTSYRGALTELGAADVTGWTVSVDMTWTPMGRSASAGLGLERSRRRTLDARREQQLQQIWIEVRDAVRDQRSVERQVAAAASFRRLAEQSLDIEQRKFMNGTSSNFVVAQRQEELAAAQLAELTAVLGHHKAAATLLHATGRLLAERHIELDVAPR